MGDKTDVWQGTLALMVLRTLETMGPQHGYGLARRIEQTSGDLLQLNYGTLYPALLKLEQEGYISPSWGISENNRKAKFYELTKAGHRQLKRPPPSGNRPPRSSRAFSPPQKRPKETPCACCEPCCSNRRPLPLHVARRRFPRRARKPHRPSYRRRHPRRARPGGGAPPGSDSPWRRGANAAGSSRTAHTAVA